MIETFHFEFVLRQSSPLRNFWVCWSSLKPDNFPEPSLQGLHGRRRSFGLRLRASTSLRHGFCLGFTSGCFLATSMVFVFLLHGWFANFTPDCAHFGWGMDFYFTPDCAHFRWDMVFQQTSCSTATSVTSAFFDNFVFEMAPKAALLGLHSGAAPVLRQTRSPQRASGWTFATPRATSRRSADFTRKTSCAYFLRPTSFG